MSSHSCSTLPITANVRFNQQILSAGCHRCRVARRLSVYITADNLFVTGGTVMRANVVVLFQLLGVNGTVLTEALTHKKIIAKGEEVGLDTHSHCGANV